MTSAFFLVAVGDADVWFYLFLCREGLVPLAEVVLLRWMEKALLESISWPHLTIIFVNLDGKILLAPTTP